MTPLRATLALAGAFLFALVWMLLLSGHPSWARLLVVAFASGVVAFGSGYALGLGAR